MGAILEIRIPLGKGRRGASTIGRLSNVLSFAGLSPIPRYYFHVLGDVPAHDLIGHECENDKDAERHGKLLARDVGTDKPDMVREGNYISVTDENGAERLRIPLRSMSA
jgi:hypothetical protein